MDHLLLVKDSLFHQVSVEQLQAFQLQVLLVLEWSLEQVLVHLQHQLQINLLVDIQ
jgi:hypothetical protein